MMPEELCGLLTESYCSKGSFRHRPAELIKIFPYVTKGPPSFAEEELASFRGVSGEVSRRIKGVRKCKELGFDAIEASLRTKIETRDFYHLLDVVKTLAFDEKGSISAFALSSIPYLSFTKDNSTLREIGAYLYNIYFLHASDVEQHDPFHKEDSGNVLHDLIHQCLPSLETLDTKTEAGSYHKMDVDLSEMFKKDWQYLCGNPSLLHLHFPELLKLYGFIYQLRVVEQLDRFFDEDALEPVFFTLEWESCSASRTAYRAGWKRLEPKIKTMFSHVNCLELLNHISPDDLTTPYAYLDLGRWSRGADLAQKASFEKSLDCLIEFYRGNIAPRLGWDGYEPFESDQWDCEVLNKVKRLWMMVDCQFKNSDRNAPASRYANWLIQFASKNFIKRRGRIGNTLALSRNQVMFLARLAVGEKEKLRLHEFWGELELRGIAFDYESRRKIVELFERLNLLEKKSDSGDAQYVRAII